MYVVTRARCKYCGLTICSEIEDCTSEWTFQPNTFDYIHARYLVGSIIDWTALFKEAFKCLKPGGWLESFEGSPHMISDDGSVPERSAISQWGKFFEEGGKKMGRTFLIIQEDIQRKAMEEAGFVDIQEWEFKVCYVYTWWAFSVNDDVRSANRPLFFPNAGPCR